MTKGWAHSGDVLLTHNVPMGYSFLPLARPRDFRHYRLLGWLGLSIQDLQPLGVPEPITRDCALFSLPAISLRQKPKHSCVIALQDGVRAKDLAYRAILDSVASRFPPHPGAPLRAAGVGQNKLGFPPPWFPVNASRTCEPQYARRK